MSQLEGVAAMVNDLQHKKYQLGKQLEELANVQTEINTLIELSGTDPQARQKLDRLQKAFPDGFKQQHDILALQASKLEENFKQLEEQMKKVEKGFMLPGNKLASAEGDVTNKPKQLVKVKRVRSYL